MELNNVFEYINTTSWQDDILDKDIIEISEKFCNEIPSHISRKKILHRICGQSGTGKTTQVSAAVQHTCKEIGQNPILIAVRTFSLLHPHYKEMLQKYGKELIREKTNGFALKCLCAVLEKLVKMGALIILEVTLLDPCFEKFVANLLETNDYKTRYHLLAVNIKISKKLIEKRRESLLGKESGRIILKSTNNYFNKILPIALNFLIQKFPNPHMVMWNAFDKLPVYDGKIGDCLDSFEKNRKIIINFVHSEKELLDSKISYYMNNKNILFYGN